METIPLRTRILETIIRKSTLKQRVFDNTFSVFNELKETLLEMASELDDELDEGGVHFSQKALNLIGEDAGRMAGSVAGN